MSAHGDLTAVAWNGERHATAATGGHGLPTAQPHGDLDRVWNGERFVAVGYHGAIVHSSDCDHWQPASRPAVPFRVARPDDDPHQIYYYFSGIVWNGERFVAVG